MKNLLKIVLLSSLILSCPIYAAEKQSTVTIAQLPKLTQESQHEDVARRIASRLTRSHYRDVSLNKEFADKIFQRYLELLDYGKYLFLRSDIDRFEAKKTDLAAELKSGQLNIAYELYNFALQKRFQYFQDTIALLDKPMSFNGDDEINIDPDKEDWANSEQELSQRWYKKVKLDELNLLLAGKKPPEIKSILEKRYQTALKRLTQTHSEDAFQTIMNAFAREIDPHTSYLAPKIKKQFNSEMNLSFEGIGAVLKAEDESAVIASLVPGGPASKSKEIAIGDKIVGVGQEGKSIIDVIGWRLDDIVELIRGPKGTKVILEILPVGHKSKLKTITLVRDKIRLEDRAVKSSVVNVNGSKVGILTVPSFYMGLAKDTIPLLSSLKKQNVKGIVIDLRGNGGGSLSESIDLSGLFIEKGPIVQVKDAVKRVQQYDDTDNLIYYNGPLVVLVDRNSASASEIFAAAMQDYSRAIIVGEPTFGKGTVQTHQPLTHVYDKVLHPNWPELGALQYTIQKFYRINGGSTQLKGVVPDILVPTSEIVDEYGESYEDNALPWDSINSAKYSKVADLSDIVPNLRKSHNQRIANDKEFAYIQEDIEQYKKRKNRKNLISLNYTVREKENKEYDDKKLKRANERLVSQGKKAIKSLKDLPKDNKEPDPYLDESVQILNDLAARYPVIKGNSLVENE